MVHVDDLVLISERDLFIVSGIPPGIIRAVYARAQGMMVEVCVENKDVILEMDEMRREWRESNARISLKY